MLGPPQGQVPKWLAHDAVSPDGIALTWSDALRTGLEVIDEQHKTLVGIFNALAAAQARGTEAQVMAPLFEELVRYTREHFRTEAELMQTWPVNAAHRAMHLRAHQSFVDFLHRAQTLAQSHAADVAVDLLAFLAQWLLHHIMGVDARMARQIAALQAAPDGPALAPLEQGETLETLETPTAEDMLVDSVSRLNDALGHRTFALLDLNRKLQTEIEQRNSMEHRLTRLKDFNTLLAQINQAITVYDDEESLLEAICELAVHEGGLKLAWIARPDAQGRFQKVAAAGETAYLQAVEVSADPDVPQGQGSMGRAWRDGVASFNQSFASAVALKPWQDWARNLGLRANASLPLYRDARIWAVLTVYHEQEDVFDAELKAVLEALALDVSRGLDRLDLIARERQSSLVRESLLSNALAGIVMTQGPQIVDANAHFARMLGYAHQRDLVGQSTRSL
ncbi:MAG: bacteriohemerythrin, partial [Betaproteobacteria bacterium]|nr:bacteriohemerythrin [Betaproteobacteria bacterium]